MKLSMNTKAIVLAGLTTLSMSVMAAEPIIGTWQTYEDGQAKAQVRISQSGNTFTGVLVHGNTEKAKKYEGKTVLVGCKSVGNNAYEGKAKDPRWGFGLPATINVNGSHLSIKVPVKGSQTWSRIK